MTILLTVLLIALSAAILVLHALSVFGQGGTARISAYICILLHILLFTDMLLLALPMDTAVLVFLTSVLCYSVLNAVQYLRGRRREDGENK